MSRVRETLRRTALLAALASIALTGCIFSPNEGELPPPPPLVIDSPEKVVAALERAYQTRDYDLFVKLLANDPNRNAEYLFILSEATEEGDTQWGWETEARAHRRMFDPQDTLPGELPVPNDLWLQSIDITLTLQGSFTERTDLYSSDGGADGLLDRNVWKATSALYSTDVFFAMAGEVDYQVTGQADFVIVEDLAKSDGEDGQFLIYIWEDLGAPGKAQTADNPT